LAKSLGVGITGNLETRPKSDKNGEQCRRADAQSGVEIRRSINPCGSGLLVVGALLFYRNRRQLRRAIAPRFTLFFKERIRQLEVLAFIWTGIEQHWAT